jgi:HD superfamily phosphohydrolase
MLSEDLRSWERLTPFEPIVEPIFDYENQERKLTGMRVDDRLYGSFDFDRNDNGDSAIMEILTNDYFNRLALVRQLILPPDIATRPETADMTRYEHSIGCMLLTRKLGGDSKQQLRALLHDIATTAFSHLGDWLKQGMDGADDHHDAMQPELLRLWGIDEILTRHGFTLDDVSNQGKKDFVERPSPDLCVDRVDYALREFARWTCPEEVGRLIDSLRVQDDMVVFDSPTEADIFARYYRDLFIWHWAHDLHMVKEVLFFNLIRHAIQTEILKEEDMYGVDDELLTKIDLWGDEESHALLWLARQKSLNFEHHKGTEETLCISAADKTRLLEDKSRLYFYQRGFKERWVDPSFMDQETGERIVLSAVDGDHRRRIERLLDDINNEFQPDSHEYGFRMLHLIAMDVEPEIKQKLSGLGNLL